MIRRGPKPSRRGLALCWLPALAAFACAGEEHKTPPEVLAPDTTTYEVTYKSAVLAPAQAALEAALVTWAPVTGEARFRPGVAELDGLVAGQVVVLPGMGLFRVKASAVREGDRVLSLEPAALTDAIEDGTVAWSVGFHAGALERMQGSTDAPAKSGIFTDGTLSYSGTIDDFQITFSLTPSGDDFLMKLTAKYDKNGAKMNIAGSGTLRGFRNEANIVIRAGSITEFRFEHHHLEGDLEVHFGGVELGTGDLGIKIPAKITLPFSVGPFPMFTSTGGTFEVAASLGAKASNIAKGKFHFKAKAGLALEGGKLVPLGQLEDQSLSYEGGEAMALTVDSGLGLLVNFPQVEFGIGIPGTAASAFLKLKQEVVSNYELRYEAAGNFPVITGNCLRVNLNLGGYIGGSMKVFNITLAEQEVPIFTYLNPLYKKGDACND